MLVVMFIAMLVFKLIKMDELELSKVCGKVIG